MTKTDLEQKIKKAEVSYKKLKDEYDALQTRCHILEDNCKGAYAAKQEIEQVYKNQIVELNKQIQFAKQVISTAAKTINLL